MSELFVSESSADISSGGKVSVDETVGEGVGPVQWEDRVGMGVVLLFKAIGEEIEH